MKRRLLVVLGIVALSAIAVAQPDPDPTRPPGDPGSAAGSGSNPGGSGAPTGSGAPAGSGSGSAAPKGPKIIPLPTDLNAPQVSAAAAPTTVQLGQKFTVFVSAIFNAGVEVNLREPLDLGPGFEITRRVSEDKPTGDGTTTREWQLEVVAWDLGDLIIPPIAVTYTSLGKADQVGTNAVKVKVNGMLGDVVDDPKAMRADAPPTELWTRDWFWLYVAIGGALLVGCLTTLVVMIRNGRRRKMMLVGTGFVTTSMKFDTAGERALYKLGELEKSGVLDDDDTRKKGYAAMVEILREYIGSRYRVATLDLTSAELVKKLEPHAPDEERSMIEAWLEKCDIVKYGGLRATAGQAKETIEAARTLVVVTSAQPAAKPEPPPPPPSPPDPPPSPGPRARDSEDALTTPFEKEEAA